MKLAAVLGFVRNNLAILIPVALVLGLVKGHWYPMAYSRAICVSALLVMSLGINQNLLNRPDQLLLAVLPIVLFYAATFLISHVLGAMPSSRHQGGA